METDINITGALKNDLLIHIQQHLDADLSLEQLARHSGYSPFHLHRLMREVLDEPLGQYIKRKRIESAATLLGLTDYPAALIKELVGYQNDTAFSKAFRQIMGCSPRTFRRQQFFDRFAGELPAEYISLNYRIEYLKDWKGLAFPSLADYFDRSLFNSWLPAKALAAREGLALDQVQAWGVGYECPNVTGRSRCRYDAVLAPCSAAAASATDFNTSYAGGKFAVFTFCIPYHCFRNLSLLITNHLREHATLTLREGCTYLRYQGNPMDDSPDYMLTDWYIPVH